MLIEFMVELASVLMVGDTRHRISRNVNETYFPTFQREVESDLSFLIQYRDIRDPTEMQSGVFKLISAKYSRSYCPSYHYQDFSRVNKRAYHDLRLRIDNILAV